MSLGKQEQLLNKVSKRIADLRKAKGFTRERLAEDADIDRVALANIETGRRRPTLVTLYKLATALNVEVKDLENELVQLEDMADNDREIFLRFAFNFVQDTSSHFLGPELLQESRLRCKQIIFPAGFWVDAQQNVYTPEISTLYRLASNKKDAEASLNSHLVQDVTNVYAKSRPRSVDGGISSRSNTLIS